jgi:hypothetical protein
LPHHERECTDGTIAPLIWLKAVESQSDQLVAEDLDMMKPGGCGRNRDCSRFRRICGERAKAKQRKDGIEIAMVADMRLGKQQSLQVGTGRKGKVFRRIVRQLDVCLMYPSYMKIDLVSISLADTRTHTHIRTPQSV